MILPKLINRRTKIVNFNTLSIYAKTWRANIQANGGTIDPAVLLIFDNYFFKPAAAAGNILNQLDRLNFYAGTGNETAARTNVINNNFFVSKVNAPIWDNSQGYRSAGTGYLNLNYNPNTQAVKLTQTSASIFAVVKTPSFVGNVRTIGGGEASFAKLLGLTRTATPDLNASLNGGAAITNTNTTSIGNVFFAGQRNGTAIKSIINANESSGTSTSVGLANLSAFELSININGSPITAFDTNSHLCSGHGSANLDLQGLRAILNNLFTALGV